MSRTHNRKNLTHKTGKPMVPFGTGHKVCRCNKPTCTRAGGAACIRRFKRTGE